MAEGRYSCPLEPHMAEEELWAWWMPNWWVMGDGVGSLWRLVSVLVTLELYQGSV